jgi:divalent metal cation (Fe/Co/Zn/Cd) transporter
MDQALFMDQVLAAEVAAMVLVAAAEEFWAVAVCSLAVVATAAHRPVDLLVEVVLLFADQLVVPDAAEWQ